MAVKSILFLRMESDLELTEINNFFFELAGWEISASATCRVSHIADRFTLVQTLHKFRRGEICASVVAK